MADGVGRRERQLPFDWQANHRLFDLQLIANHEGSLSKSNGSKLPTARGTPLLLFGGELKTQMFSC